MEQKHFMDIQHIREEDTELRERNTKAFTKDCVISITEKVDGSNFSIAWDQETEELKCFSRKRELDFQNTLNGFWNFVQTLPEKTVNEFKKHPNWRVFGEANCKNKIIYNDTGKVKHWYVYDIYDVNSRRYLMQGVVKQFCKDAGLEYVHELYYGPFISWEHCRSFMNSPAYGERQEGCFEGSVKILMGDGTQKKINQIKIGDVVKSYNTTTNEIENKKVVNIYNNGKKDLSEWINIAVFPKGTASRNMISGNYRVTKNHKYWDGKQYTEISKLDYVYHYGKVFDHIREQAFLGLMCSDGHYSKGRFYISQKRSRMYCFKELFNDFLSPKENNQISGKGTEMSVISFQKCLTIQYMEKYCNGDIMNRIKIFEDLDDIGWAFFFVGDGSYSKECIQLCIASFTEEEANIIKKLFDKRYGINSCICVDKRVSKPHAGISICTNKTDTKKIIKIWSKYILESHRYKLKDLQDIEKCFEYPPIQYGIVKRQLFNKHEVKGSSYDCGGRKNITAYDIEVEGNHNYFVNGCLVHNCVVKIQGEWDENDRNPHVLKIVNEDFRESMKTKEKIIDPEAEAAKEEARNIMESIVTPRRVEKILFKLRDEGILPEKIQPTDFKIVAQNLPKAVWDDIMKEEKELVMQCGEYGGKLCQQTSMSIARDILLGT